MTASNSANAAQVTLSGYNHIDSLLRTDILPWSSWARASNTLYYNFAQAEAFGDLVTNFESFSTAQQTATKEALKYVQSITGIKFVETKEVTVANLIFTNGDVAEPAFAGYYTPVKMLFPAKSGGQEWVQVNLITMDNVEHKRVTTDLSKGKYGYELLLHEIGHTLGLKHPFSGEITLPEAEDSTDHTLMSYTQTGTKTGYSLYDVAALHWLYGGDGLNGKYGLDSVGLDANGKGRFLVGTSNDDMLKTGAANDLLFGSWGDDVLDGGGGLDTAMFNGSSKNYQISSINGTIAVSDKVGKFGKDTLIGIERIKFSDKSIAFDVDGVAGKVYRLYQAAFDRAPDAGGLGYWINAMEQYKMSIAQVAEGFIGSTEFREMYGVNPSKESLVNAMYAHVLHRAADTGGLDFWGKQLQQGMSTAKLLEAFSESAENQAQLIGKIQNGMEFTLAG